MKFKYDKKIDIECWERIIKANSTYGKWFNTKFPTKYKITFDMGQKAKIAVKNFQREWDRANINFDEGMVKIFDEKFPDVTCYVNTSLYSMQNYPGYISISMFRKDPVATIIHEANHFMFKKYFSDTPRIEEVKEIITIINNNVFGVKDNGWNIFKKQRETALKIWGETRDIKSVIKSAIESLKNKI